MNACRRIAGGLGLLLATIGLIASLIGGVGVWIVKEPVHAKATHVFDRIDGALNLADDGLAQAQASLTRASERLENVREERRQAVGEPGTAGTIGRMMARTVQQRLAPELGNAQETLHHVAEAAVVVNAMLEDVGNFPLLATSGLDLDRVNDMNRRLADVGPAAWELSRLLGESGPDPDAQVSRIDNTLQTLPALVAEYQAQVSQVRQRVETAQAKVNYWMTPGTALISFSCFWIALSQVSVLCHAWSWLRGPRPSAE
jgi:hypothetical protein